MRWLLLVLLLIPLPVLAANWVDHPRIIDGDTLAFGQTRVRLLSMDAFESSQTCTRDGQEYACGREATRALTELISDRVVYCYGTKGDRYGRALVHCSVDGHDLGREMVRQGWAIAAYGDEYDADQEQARATHAGAWAGTFEEPARYRHRQH